MNSYIKLAPTCVCNINKHILYGHPTDAKVFQELNLTMKQNRYNVRFFHTYRDEDHIGTCKGIARKVHRKLLELRLLGRFLLRLRTFRQGKRSQPVRGASHAVKKCGVWSVETNFFHNIYKNIYYKSPPG